MKPKDSQEQFVRNLVDCQPSLYAYILSLLPNRDDAADILQDTNLVMWRRSGEYAEGTNFLAWAHKIVRFKVLAHHRNRRRDRHIFDDSLFDLLANEAEGRAHDREGITDTLDDCMAELPPAQRELVRQRYAPGASVREMAQERNQTVAVLSVTLSRIRNVLLECIQRKRAGRSRQ
jgi:RNA polymerase sigma-70 factor (ECF subfamily)